MRNNDNSKELHNQEPSKDIAILGNQKYVPSLHIVSLSGSAGNAGMSQTTGTVSVVDIWNPTSQADFARSPQGL